MYHQECNHRVVGIKPTRSISSDNEEVKDLSVHWLQDEGTINSHAQVEFGHAKAFLFQANMQDELMRFLPQTLP